MDIQDPLPILYRLTISSLMKTAGQFKKDITLAEGYIVELGMYRGIIEPIQLTEFFIDHESSECKYKLVFQFSPDFLLRNIGFMIGGGAGLKWQVSLPRFAQYTDIDKARASNNFIDWINCSKISLLRNDQFSVNTEYFEETLDEYLVK
jgi:hypothetical protein